MPPRQVANEASSVPVLAQPAIDVPRTALRGSLWTYLSFASGKALQFASTVILARLLLPKDFGLMGYCLVAMQFLVMLNVLGIDALVARRTRIREAANAAFIINLGIGLLLYGLAW